MRQKPKGKDRRKSTIPGKGTKLPNFFGRKDTQKNRKISTSDDRRKKKNPARLSDDKNNEVESEEEVDPAGSDFDDEEIDEDGAFNSSDEEKYGAFFNHENGDSLNEDEEDINEGGLLSDLLDDNYDNDADSVLEGSDINCEDNESDIPDLDVGSDIEGETNEQNENLLDFVNKLEEVAAVSKKKKDLHNAMQNMKPSNFGTVSGNGLTSGLTLDVLLDGLDGTKGFSAVKQRVERFTQNAAPPVAPSGKIVEARTERQVAYKEATQEMEKWVEPVMAEQALEVVDFRREVMHPREQLSNAALISKFRPQTDMEMEIANLIKGGGADEKSILDHENKVLQAREFTAEEVAARQGELKKMRALLFYHEQKRHRINKIKSKLYHKIRNKKANRENDGERARLMELDPTLALEIEGREMKKRAEERMTLRHRDTTKWVKKAMKRGAADSNTKAAVLEQLALSKELRRRQEKNGSSSEEDEEEMYNELSNIGKADDPDLANPPKGLFSMGFMQRGVARQVAAAKVEKDALMKELIQLESRGDSDGDCKPQEFEENDVSHVPRPKQLSADELARQKKAMSNSLMEGELQSFAVSLQGGMQASVSGAITVNLGVKSSTASASHEIEINKRAQKNINILSISADLEQNSKSQEGILEPLKEDFSAINPWLSDKVGGKRGKRKEISGPANQETAKAMLSATVESAKKLEEKSKENSVPEGGTTNKKRKKRSKGGGMGSNDPLEISQEELIARAFVAPDIDEEFKADKDAEIDAEIAKLHPTPLVAKAGWGSWAGLGTHIPKPSKAFLNKVEKAEAAAALAKNSRKDAKLPTVIINQKRQKRSAHLKMEKVPYPYTSKEQYERAMRQPLGPDWNTPLSTAEMTRPKVIFGAGTVIDPIKATKQVKKDAKTVERSNIQGVKEGRGKNFQSIPTKK